MIEIRKYCEDLHGYGDVYLLFNVDSIDVNIFKDCIEFTFERPTLAYKALIKCEGDLENIRDSLIEDIARFDVILDEGLLYYFDYELKKHAIRSLCGEICND